MSRHPAPPSPRLVALDPLRDLPGAPDLSHFPDGTLAELVVLGLADDEATAYVAVYVENATVATSWVTQMDFDAFLGELPTWTLVNLPDLPDELEGVGRAPARRTRQVRRSIPRPRAAEFARAWRGSGRPARATDQYLLSVITLVPPEYAADFVEAIRRLRLSRIDRTSRELIARVCDTIASIEEKMPKAS